MMPLLRLLKDDQKNIQLFRDGKISKKIFSETSCLIENCFIEECKKRGFPFKDSNTPEEYKAGIVLLLHTPTDFIEETLADFKKLSPKKIDPADLAYLIDKVRVQKDEDQVYGTQFKKSPNGEVNFLPIENIDMVDERRESVGLCTLKEYKAFINGERDSVYKK